MSWGELILGCFGLLALGLAGGVFFGLMVLGLAYRSSEPEPDPPTLRSAEVARVVQEIVACPFCSWTGRESDRIESCHYASDGVTRIYPGIMLCPKCGNGV